MRAKDAEALLQTLDSLMVHITNDINHPTMTYHDEGFSFGHLQAKPARRSTGIANLNGVRIDLDETATIIQKGQDNIQNSVAIVAKEDGRQWLVVFVTVQMEDDQDTRDDETVIQTLAKCARQALPHWSIPSFIIPIDILPYEDNKVNRTQLESHFLSMSLEERDRFTVKEQNSEWSPLECIFRRILSRVSRLPEAEIERTQTIFHLGLDSISAISVSSELRRESIFLSVAEILRAATIERMAAFAATVNGEIPQTPIDTEKTLQKALGNIAIQQLLTGIPEESIESVSPGTSGQFYMLSAWRNSNYKLFMPTFTFKCRKIELPHVSSAWESVVRQEPILRTTFLLTENEDTPLIQLTLKNPPAQHDWYESSTKTNDALIRFLFSQEQQKPISLELPPVRLTTLNTPTETTIFLTIHHALYDGVSLPLLLAKFQYFLENDVKHLPTPNPETSHFSDFVTFAYSQDAQKQSDFWRKYLDNSVSTLVPLKYPNMKHPDRTAVFQPGVLGESKLLESRCNTEGVSLHSVFLAAYAKVYMHHLSLRDGPAKQRDDVVFGIYLSNRHLPVPDLASMAAPTLNIVPLRIRSPRTTPLIKLARQVQRDLVEIGNPSNSVVGLWQVEKWTGVQVDCFFNFLKLPASLGEEHSTQETSEKDQVRLEEMKIDLEPQNEVKQADLRLESQWMDSAKVKNFIRFEGGIKTYVYSQTNLDIEVAVRGDKIDIGVFSWAQHFSNEDSQNTIEWMCQIVTDGLES